MRLFRAVSILTVALLLALDTTARADAFVLDTGAEIDGVLQNPGQQNRLNYRIELGTPGRSYGVVVLDDDQVHRVYRPTEEELRYEQLFPTVEDTVEAQWKLAEWCRNNRLLEQREGHLARIVELDPNHAEAQRGLGKSFLGGQWTTRDEFMKKQGMVKNEKGEWKLAQEMQLAEDRAGLKQSQADWAQQIKTWRKWLTTERNLEAKENFRKIRDPLAVDAITRLLEDEPLRDVRIFLIKTLANIPSGDALMTIAQYAMLDPDEEVRYTCLDLLKDRHTPNVISYFVGELKSKDNRLVNRAGTALGVIREPMTIEPLIDALVTEHLYKIVKAGGDGATTFDSRGTFSAGSGPTHIKRQHQNVEVLKALNTITGLDFSFDAQAWKYWYTQSLKNRTLTGAQWQR